MREKKSKPCVCVLASTRKSGKRICSVSVCTEEKHINDPNILGSCLKLPTKYICRFDKSHPYLLSFPIFTYLAPMRQQTLGDYKWYFSHNLINAWIIKKKSEIEKIFLCMYVIQFKLDCAIG